MVDYRDVFAKIAEGMNDMQTKNQKNWSEFLLGAGFNKNVANEIVKEGKWEVFTENLETLLENRLGVDGVFFYIMFEVYSKPDSTVLTQKMKNDLAKWGKLFLKSCEVKKGEKVVRTRDMEDLIMNFRDLYASGYGKYPMAISDMNFVLV